MPVLIVERLEDAVGDVWLRCQDGRLWHYRDGKFAFRVASIAGWNAQALPVQVGFGFPSEDGPWSEPIFAPTAEDVIRQHLAEQPFGKVILEQHPYCQEADCKTYSFETVHGGVLITFTPDSFDILALKVGPLSNPESVGIHALHGEVIAWQTTCANGTPEQTAIGREIARMGGA